MLIGRVYGELETLRADNEALKREIAELKKQLAGSAATAKVAEPYSMRAEEKRQRARGRRKRQEPKKQRRGRIAKEEKIRRAEETIDIYPDGIAYEQCKLSHVRVVWRMVDGRAKLVAYRMFRGPGKKYGVIPGVSGPAATNPLSP